MKRILLVGSTILMLMFFTALNAQSKASKQDQTSRENKSKQTEISKSDNTEQEQPVIKVIKKKSRSVKVQDIKIEEEKPAPSRRETKSDKRRETYTEPVRETSRQQDEYKPSQPVRESNEQQVNRERSQQIIERQVTDEYVKPAQTDNEQYQRQLRRERYQQYREQKENGSSNKPSTQVTDKPDLSQQQERTRSAREQSLQPTVDKPSETEKPRSEQARNERLKPSIEQTEKPGNIKTDRQDNESSVSSDRDKKTKPTSIVSPQSLKPGFNNQNEQEASQADIKGHNPGGSHQPNPDMQEPQHPIGDITPPYSGDDDSSGHNGDHHHDSWDDHEGDNHYDNWDRHHSHHNWYWDYYNGWDWHQPNYWGWNDNTYWDSDYWYWHRNPCGWNWDHAFYVFGYYDYPSYEYWTPYHYWVVQPVFTYNFNQDDDYEEMRGYLLADDWDYNPDTRLGMRYDISTDMYEDVHPYKDDCPVDGYGIVTRNDEGDYSYYHFDSYGDRLARQLLNRYRGSGRKIYIEVKGFMDPETHTLNITSLKRVNRYSGSIISISFFPRWFYHRL
jgi:hypothetical protein